MKLEELGMLLALLRTHGVTRFEEGDLSLSLGPLPAPMRTTTPPLPAPPDEDAPDTAPCICGETVDGRTDGVCWNCGRNDETRAAERKRAATEAS